MPIQIIHSTETFFFSHIAGQLRQWIHVTVQNDLEQAVRGYFTIEAGGTRVETPVEIAPGVQVVRAYAPVLWPNQPAELKAALRLSIGEEHLFSEVSVGRHRPWTVYLLSDSCVDYVWAYESDAAMRRDDAALVKAELHAAEATQDGPEAEHNHYNLVHTREIEFFLEHYPEQEERLREHLRRGTLTLNPILNMCLTANMSLEELIRQFYPARQLARRYRLHSYGEKAYRYANLQETPTAAWVTATVLASSGIDRLVRSILPYECPWAKRLENPLLYRWEGPDGSRVLVRQRNEDYVEGNFVLKGPQAINTHLHENILPAHEAHGDAYPFDAIGLVGLYGDLAYHTRGLAAVKAEAIAAYNRQGWEYPKLVNASHKQFWDDIDAQIQARQFELRVLRGDYGSSWDSWPTCLAVSYAAWRQAQERARTADTLAAILGFLEPEWPQTQPPRLEEGWRNLLYLADHAWNGATPGNRQINADLRREWRRVANRSFETVIKEGIAALSKHIPTGETGGVLVFNGLGWKRKALARLPMENGAPCPELVDPASGQALPSQPVEDAGGKHAFFMAQDVPPIGFRYYPLRQGQAQASPVEIPFRAEEYCLEGPFYALAIDPKTGGVRQLYDKIRRRQLVDSSSPYTLNEAVYMTAGDNPIPEEGSYQLYRGVSLAGMEERRARLLSIKPGACGPVFAELHVHSAIGEIQIESTLRVYADLDRLDIDNHVYKPVSVEKQELDFIFPFLVPDCQARYETPGAIISPAEEQLPGAGLAWTVVRHFVDLYNEEFGVTFSTADSGVVEFGHRTTGEDPQALHLGNGTLLAIALQNCIDWNESIHDQHGETNFTFRYSLRGHSAGFDPLEAIHFGWEDNNDLRAMLLPANQPDGLPVQAHSFITVSPENVLLTTLKIAEEDGLIARLWECSGRDTIATIQVKGLGVLSAAQRTDMLEENLENLQLEGDQTTVMVPGRGIVTVRLLLHQ